MADANEHVEKPHEPSTSKGDKDSIADFILRFYILCDECHHSFQRFKDLPAEKRVRLDHAVEKQRARVQLDEQDLLQLLEQRYYKPMKGKSAISAASMP